MRFRTVEDGFQVGSDSRVNGSSAYDWVAFRSAAAGSADLEITMAANRDTLFVGQAVDFTIAVRNPGPDASTNVAVRDSVPTGLSYVSHVADRGTYVPASGLWNIGTLPALGSATLTIRALADSVAVEAKALNVASITSSDAADSIQSNNADSTVTYIFSLATTVLVDSSGTLFPATVFTGDPGLGLHIGINNPSATGVMLDPTTEIAFSDSVQTYTAPPPLYVDNHEKAAGMSSTWSNCS